MTANLKTMKILTTILIFVKITTFGQTIKVDTFRLEKGQQFKNTTPNKIIFPIICSHNKKIDSLINTDLKNRFTNNEYPTNNLESTLIKWTQDRITFIDFQVTYNQNGILSINVSAEGCGAYCSSWKEYFNYSTSSGKRLNISDIIDDLVVFEKRVTEDRKKQYEAQRQELKETLKDKNSKMNDVTYNWVLEDYVSCEKNFSIESFAIHHNHLEVIDNCDLPHAIRCYTPIIELKYRFFIIEDKLKIKH